LVIKTTFKSHFKLKKNFKKNKSKFLFVKNIIIFFLFFKVFFKNCKLTISYKNKKKLQTSLLKAPSRHKKFFHQICFENFILKTYFYFFFKNKIATHNSIIFFKRINLIFEKFGSNVLTKTKLSARFNISYNNFFYI
jgi:hypothetical protein